MRKTHDSAQKASENRCADPAGHLRAGRYRSGRLFSLFPQGKVRTRAAVYHADITVTDNGSGDCYTFTDSAACTALLEGLQEIHLYRENSNQNPDGTSSYTVTLDFSGDAVRLSLKDGCCRNANGTVYDCGETARPFLTALTQQLREQTYSDAENIYQ